MQEVYRLSLVCQVVSIWRGVFWSKQLNRISLPIKTIPINSKHHNKEISTPDDLPASEQWVKLNRQVLLDVDKEIVCLPFIIVFYKFYVLCLGVMLNDKL